MSHKEKSKRSKHKIKRKRLKLGDDYHGKPPEFIIIGAQKGGTTTLHRYLTDHPDVSEALRKEIHYFSWSYSNGMLWYLSHFPEPDGFRLVGEASTSYIHDPEVPDRIRQAIPAVKLIALLRNPIDRAYSQYQMNVRKKFEELSFEDAIAQEPERLRSAPSRSSTLWRYSSYLARGRYAEQLERWFAVFPREQLLILQSETFFAQPEIGLAQTLAFLDLRSWHPADFDVYNSGAYTDMHPETRARLVAYFAPHNQRLYELLGQDFGWDHD
jgi:hypothetical protein